MTCNQLVLLGCIYHGTYDKENKIGTFKKDLNVLEGMKLITKCRIVDYFHDPNSDHWTMSMNGRKKYEALLELMS